MYWLREHMRDRTASCNAGDSAENILSFRCPPSVANDVGGTALDLLQQVAEFIREVEDHANERHARAETLARSAIEELKTAQDRVRSAESERRAAEARIEEVGDRVRQVEKAFERAASTIAAAEAQISAAEERARNTEMRATEAENALKRIEAAIRTEILDKRHGNSRRAGTAA